jgi:hypothetical protein
MSFSGSRDLEIRGGKTMSQQLSPFSETEKKAAERYLWWPIYLVREKRRLAGITEAVRGMAVAGSESLDDSERLDELLARVDGMDEMGDDEAEEAKTQGISLRDEETIHDDREKRKHAGRGALLGRKKHSDETEEF